MRIQNKSAGFAVLEIMIGIAVIGIALGMVGVARQKEETVRRKVQTSIEQAAQARSKLEEATRKTFKEEPPVETKEKAVERKLQQDERPTTSKQDKDLPRTKVGDVNKRDQKRAEGKRPQASSGGKGAGSFDLGSCFPGSPDPSCIAIFGEEPYSWYEQQQQEGTAAYYQAQEEAQQQLYQEAYYYQQQQQQQMFDPNQFLENPYEQYNPVFQDLYQQIFPGYPGY